jgi:DNA-binding FadR family transcriptional regulator
LINQFRGRWVLTRPDISHRADAVAQVRSLIAAGSYSPGDRLPPERELIERLGMTRATLRHALDTLEREGAIWRHVGKGTFLANHAGYGVQDSLASLSTQITPVRMMQARVCIESAIAREAAIHASAEAIIRMKLAIDRAESAPSWGDYETQDDLFHRSVAQAADNLLLLALVRNTQRPPRDHSSFSEHRRIASTIEQRDPAAAHDAMRQHIGSVSARLFEEA